MIWFQFKNIIKSQGGVFCFSSFNNQNLVNNCSFYFNTANVDYFQKFINGKLNLFYLKIGGVFYFMHANNNNRFDNSLFFSNTGSVYQILLKSLLENYLKLHKFVKNGGGVFYILNSNSKQSFIRLKFAQNKVRRGQVIKNN
jgi:hypothetical protein